MVDSIRTLGKIRYAKFWFNKTKNTMASERVEEERKLGRVFWLALVWLLMLSVAAATVSFLPINDPLKQDYSAMNAGFSWKYPFGTDHLGRDILSRVLHGASVSLSVAFTAPFIGMLFGVVLGMLAGYFRAKIDSAVSIFIDSILAFPNIVLAIAYLFYAGETLFNLIFVIAFYTIPQFTRISRATTLLYAQREFVDAARAQGASNLRILVHELLPNVMVPVAAFSLVIMSFTIILEGGLSFLGVGIPPPTPTWGGMIAGGLEELSENSLITFVPALFLFLTILSINLMADKLRSLTDVKSSSA